MWLFDQAADAQLNLKWLTLRNTLGLPDQIDEQVLMTVLDFAILELPNMALNETRRLNPSLPLTGNQEAQKKQKAENDKKRAAAITAKADEQMKSVAAKVIEAKLKGIKGKNSSSLQQ